LPERRLPAQTASRGAALAVASAAAAATSLAYLAQYRWPYTPKLEHIAIDRRGLPAPLRIGFITDLHVGPMIRGRDVDRAMEILFAARPDLLFLGGDYICESPRYAPEAAAALRSYIAAAPLGAFAVLGNHDYANDAPRLASLFESIGICVLRNESARIRAYGADLWIAGIDDALLSTADPVQTYACIPAGAKSIALWHEPDWADDIVKYNPVLQLSGHTHGGQFRVPFLGHLAAPKGGRRYVLGMHDVAGMPVYTSRGVGVYRPPIRVLCPPEVTLVTLT
jgi:predicted MPP superfamily phosphohydrolase